MSERDGQTRTDAKASRSLTPLVGIAKDAAHLLQQEARLARQETIEKLMPAAQYSAAIVGGSLLTTVGITYLLQAIVRVLATRMPMWLASLLSGSAFVTGGVLLIGWGSQQFKNLSLVPRKTLTSLKEDVAWLRRQIKSKLI